MTTRQRVPHRAFCLRLPADLHIRLMTLAALRRTSANALACQGLETWVSVLEAGRHYPAAPEGTPSMAREDATIRQRRSRRSRARVKRAKA